MITLIIYENIGFLKKFEELNVLDLKKLVLMALFGAMLQANEINVYSHRHYDSDKLLMKKFEETSGIKVNVITAKAEELVSRLALEGANTPADVLLTSDIGNLYEATEKGLLQPIHSKILATNIPSHLRDKNNQWFGLTKRARVFVYNPAKINPAMLSDYLGLGNSVFKGKVITRTSANSYNKSLLASIIANHGEAKAQAFANALVVNFAREPKGNDRDQITAVASGEADIAIVNTYYLGLMHASKSAKDVDVAKSVKIFFPDQKGKGTHINISGAGVSKYAKHKENAQKFIEFLSSLEAQKIFAEANYEYPVHPKAKAAGVVASWGIFKEDTINLEEIGKNTKLAVGVATKANWK